MNNRWPALVSNAPGRVPEYVEPEWETVTVRVLRPFRFHPHFRRAGFSFSMGDCRTLTIGEVLAMPEYDSRDAIALGRAELV